ncbi:hypothetical protein L218DRAFT_70600 [Marasmius fiardii PR-910]|nr:hypothetical protein L218DRAFT_70600 [Marasmius fiardii PR-910]
MLGGATARAHRVSSQRSIHRQIWRLFYCSVVPSALLANWGRVDRRLARMSGHLFVLQHHLFVLLSFFSVPSKVCCSSVQYLSTLSCTSHGAQYLPCDRYRICLNASARASGMPFKTSQYSVLYTNTVNENYRTRKRATWFTRTAWSRSDSMIGHDRLTKITTPVL